MFGHRYFGARYFGPRYWGDGTDPLPAVFIASNTRHVRIPPRRRDVRDARPLRIRFWRPNMPRTLEKRTTETLLFDLIADGLLPTGATLTGTPVLSSDPAGLTFGTPAINGSAITYPDGSTAAIGKVVQVLIGGGEIPTGDIAAEYIVRALCDTSISGEELELTARMQINDTP